MDKIQDAGKIFVSPFLFAIRNTFLQDITQQQHWSALELSFYHDINNLVAGLVGASEMLAQTTTDDSSRRAKVLNKLILRLAQEAKFQQCLTNKIRCSQEDLSAELQRKAGYRSRVGHLFHETVW